MAQSLADCDALNFTKKKKKDINFVYRKQYIRGEKVNGIIGSQVVNGGCWNATPCLLLRCY